MKVVVVGAGLAGLSAATELQGAGADVVLLEARGACVATARAVLAADRRDAAHAVAGAPER